MTPGIGSSGADSAARQAALSGRPQVQTRRVSVKLGPLGISYSTDQILWGGDAEASGQAASAPGAWAASSGAAAPGGSSVSSLSSVSDSPFVAAGQAEAPVAPAARVTGQGRRPGGGSDGVLGDVEAAGQAAAQGSAVGFDAALDQAWSVLAAGIAAAQTYDRGGRLGVFGRGAGVAEGASGAGTAEPDRSGPGQAGPVQVESVQVESGQVESGQAGPERISQEAQAARSPALWPHGADARQRSGTERGVAGSRLRRAIAAYLACAEGFAAARPMLRVTA